MNNLTLCIGGRNQIAVDAVDYILSNYKIDNFLFVPIEIDDGEHSWQPSFKKHCVDHGLTQVSLEDLYEIDNLYFFSLEFDKIIKPDKFKSKKLFNIHFSLLPAYKGMYTSCLPILHGEDITGVTLHEMDAGIDTGNIIAQDSFSIDLEDTAEVLYGKYLQNGFNLFVKHFNSIINDQYVSLEQPYYGSTYYSKAAIDFKNISIDFKKTAFEVVNQFRAYTFRVYQMPVFDGKVIRQATSTKVKSFKKPGSIISEDEISIVVSTIDYNVKLIKD